MSQPNIVLIGMPGCGKSTAGVVLAKAINYQFIDTDLLIQAQTGKLLYELIDEMGPQGFCGIENKINAHIEATQTVIATGGSVVYGPQAMAHLRVIGRVIYLKLSYEQIACRVGSLHQRGILMAPGQTLPDLFEERAPLYEKYAHDTLSIENLSLTQVVEELKRYHSAKQFIDAGKNS